MRRWLVSAAAAALLLAGIPATTQLLRGSLTSTTSPPPPTGSLVPGTMMPTGTTPWAPTDQPARVGSESIVTITPATQTLVTMANTFAGGEDIEFRGALPSGGQIKPFIRYFVCSSGLTSGHFMITQTFADATGACSGFASTGTVSGSSVLASAGFYDDAVAQWDVAEHPTGAFINATTPLCVFGYHGHGIASVQIAADGGTWTAATFTNAGTTTGQPEYCVTVNPASFADGLHEFRAIITPNVGVPRVLQSGLNANGTSAAFTTASGNASAFIKGAPTPLIMSVSSNIGRTLIPTSTVDGFTAGHQYAPANWDADNGGGSTSTPNFDANGYYQSNSLALGDVTSATALNGQTHANLISGNIVTASGVTKVTQAQAFTAGQAILLDVEALSLATGLHRGQVYYVCTDGLSGTAYQITTSPTDTGTGNCTTSTNAPTVSGASGGFVAAFPVTPATGTSPISFYYENAWGLAHAHTMGESLYLNTNTHSSINLYSEYVDNNTTTVGSVVAAADPASTAFARGTCTHLRPCATLAGAIDDMNSLALSVPTLTVSAQSVTGCALFTYSSSPSHFNLVVGDQVTFKGITAGSAPGSGFYLYPGSTGVGSTISGIPGNQEYYVVSVPASTTTFTVSGTPGGHCIPWSASDTFSSVSVYPDLSGGTIFVADDGGAPAKYGYGGGTFTGGGVGHLGRERSTINGYLNIQSFESVHSNERIAAILPLDGTSAVNGLWTEKVHLAIDIISPEDDVTTSTVTPTVAGSNNIFLDTLPSDPFFTVVPTHYFPLYGNSCVPEGYPSLSTGTPSGTPYTGVTGAITTNPLPNFLATVSGTGPYTLTTANTTLGQNYQNCASGGTLVLSADVSIPVGGLFDFWYDSATSVGPGEFNFLWHGAWAGQPAGLSIYTNVGLLQGNTTGNIFVTNAIIHDRITCAIQDVVWNTQCYNITQASTTRDTFLVGSQQHNVGLYNNTVMTLSTSQPADGSNYLQFGTTGTSNAIPSYLKPGMEFDAAGACNAIYAVITGYDLPTGKLFISLPTPAGCHAAAAAGGLQAPFMTENLHTDTLSNNTAVAENQVFVGNTTGWNYAEMFFLNGGYVSNDWAYVNNDVSGSSNPSDPPPIDVWSTQSYQPTINYGYDYYINGNPMTNAVMAGNTHSFTPGPFPSFSTAGNSLYDVWFGIASPGLPNPNVCQSVNYGEITNALGVSGAPGLNNGAYVLPAYSGSGPGC
jgi:hypothetical protein